MQSLFSLDAADLIPKIGNTHSYCDLIVCFIFAVENSAVILLTRKWWEDNYLEDQKKFINILWCPDFDSKLHEALETPCTLVFQGAYFKKGERNKKSPFFKTTALCAGKECSMAYEFSKSKEPLPGDREIEVKVLCSGKDVQYYRGMGCRAQCFKATEESLLAPMLVMLVMLVIHYCKISSHITSYMHVEKLVTT